MGVKKYKVPKGYPGIYPPPPHIPLEKRTKAILELTDKKNRPKSGFIKRIWFFLGSRILKIAIEFIYKSCRNPQMMIHPETEKLIDFPRGQFIIALWHNRLFYTVFSLSDHVAGRGHDVLAIISESDDAELIARCTELWGAYTSRGSSTRGGLKAIKKILKYTKLHFHPLITPDGPKGPKYKVKEGVAALARLARLPVVPMCFDADRKWVFNSWDNFIVPKPFSKVVISYGEPVYLDEKMTITENAQFLEKKMLDQVNELEKKIIEIKATG